MIKNQLKYLYKKPFYSITILIGILVWQKCFLKFYFINQPTLLCLVLPHRSVVFRMFPPYSCVRLRHSIYIYCTSIYKKLLFPLYSYLAIVQVPCEIYSEFFFCVYENVILFQARFSYNNEIHFQIRVWNTKKLACPPFR